MTIILTINAFCDLYIEFYKGGRAKQDDGKSVSHLSMWCLKIHYILEFFFDKSVTASQDENENSAYGPDTVTVNHSQFWFRQFLSGNFDGELAPRCAMPIFENNDKIMEIVATGRHVSTVSIAQELICIYI